ncbi:MAG: DMT family transporter [Bacillota bacterium]|nr:DMT family transporter [Bacillota bacterium]
MKNWDDRKKAKMADLALIIVAVLWGGGFVAVKDALSSVTPMYLMTFRLGIATSMFLFIPRFLKGLNWKDFWNALPVGVMLFLAFTAQAYGAVFTEPSVQGFLASTYVILVPLLYWAFYRKMPQSKVFLACVIILIGIGLVSLSENFKFNPGDVLTLLCALLYAFHILLIERATKKVDVIKLAFLQFAIATVCFGIGSLVLEPFPTAMTSRTWIVLLYAGILSTFFCFGMQTVAQKYTSSTRVSLFLSLESVFAALFGVLLLGNQLRGIQIVGFVLIFSAVLLIEIDWKSVLRARHAGSIKRK